MWNFKETINRTASDTRESIREYFHRVIFVEKLSNGMGLFFFIVAAVLISLVVAESGVRGGFTLLLAIIALPFLYAMVAYPKFGILTLFIAAYFVMFFIRLSLVDFPLGTVMDFFELLLIIGFFIKQKIRPDWSVFTNPIGIIILIWVLYNVFQVLNPSAASQLAWLYTIRSVAGVMLLYFIFAYHIRDLKFVRLILTVWIVLGVIAALYAFKQQIYGFFPFEEIELRSPRLRRLLFIAGVWRKFSIFSDPVAFAYNMVSCSLFCIAMLFRDIRIWKKIGLILLIALFLTAMLFSGTRGAYVLVPAACVLFTILKFSKKVLFLAIIGSLLFAIFINIPTGNYTVRRFQSAFKPSNDASYNVRAMNQKKIQPYIQTHPFGGGLGATGVWSIRFAPNSFLAGFPPDSGYVRVAVELGWVGLFLFCTLIFIVLKTGIDNYFRIRDPELKSYCLAMVLIIFAYAIGNYPQEAIVQFPSNIYFYFFIALITIIMRLDKERCSLNDKSTNHKQRI